MYDKNPRQLSAEGRANKSVGLLLCFCFCLFPLSVCISQSTLSACVSLPPLVRHLILQYNSLPLSPFEPHDLFCLVSLFLDLDLVSSFLVPLMPRSGLLFLIVFLLRPQKRNFLKNGATLSSRKGLDIFQGRSWQRCHPNNFENCTHNHKEIPQQ